MLLFCQKLGLLGKLIPKMQVDSRETVSANNNNNKHYHCVGWGNTLGKLLIIDWIRSNLKVDINSGNLWEIQHLMLHFGFIYIFQLLECKGAKWMGEPWWGFRPLNFFDNRLHSHSIISCEFKISRNVLYMTLFKWCTRGLEIRNSLFKFTKVV